MQFSGIDVEKFKAHSYRGASTSAAYNAGISVKDIMKTANWQSAKTFKTFYLRNIQTDENTEYNRDNFSETVLATNDTH